MSGKMDKLPYQTLSPERSQVNKCIPKSYSANYDLQVGALVHYQDVVSMAMVAIRFLSEVLRSVYLRVRSNSSLFWADRRTPDAVEQCPTSLPDLPVKRRFERFRHIELGSSSSVDEGRIFG